MKKSKKKTKPRSGKNKFIRLEEDNLKYVVQVAKQIKRSQNWVINMAIASCRHTKASYPGDVGF